MYPEEDILRLEDRLEAEGDLDIPEAESLVLKLNMVGQIFLKQGRLQECDEVLQRAAELTNPRSLPLFQENEELAMRLRVKTLNLLAVLEQRQGNLAAAIRYLKGVLHIEQNHDEQQPLTNLSVAALLIQSDKFLEATTLCKRCIRLLHHKEMLRGLSLPDKQMWATALYQLALAQDRCKDRNENKEAPTTYQKALAYAARNLEPGDPNVIALEKEFHEHPSKVPPLPPLGPAEGSAAAQPMPRPAMMYERYLGSAFIPASASVAPARAPALDGPPKALALVPKAPPSTLGRGPRTKQRTQAKFAFPADGWLSSSTPAEVDDQPTDGCLLIHPHFAALIPGPPASPGAKPGQNPMNGKMKLTSRTFERKWVDADVNDQLEATINQEYSEFRELRRQKLAEAHRELAMLAHVTASAMAAALVCAAVKAAEPLDD